MQGKMEIENTSTDDNHLQWKEVELVVHAGNYYTKNGERVNGILPSYNEEEGSIAKIEELR